MLKIWANLSTIIIIGGFLTFITFLIKQGYSTLNTKLFFGTTPPIDAILNNKPVWDGIWPALIGTTYLLALTMLIALIPGIGSGIYLAKFATGKTKKALTTATELVAGVPSIVIGLFGFVLIIILKKTLLPQATTCLLLSAFCLALLVIPSLIITTKNSIESLPTSLEQTGTALGLTEKQNLYHILLPSVTPGILGGIMLATGRAIEDTAVIMLTGAVANAGLPAGLTAKYEALPFLIYYTAAQYIDETELAKGFGTTIILLILSTTSLFIAWLLERTMAKKWKGTK